jgi:hypothetical protein
MGMYLITSVPDEACALPDEPSVKPVPTPTGKYVRKSGTLKSEPEDPKVVPITVYRSEYVEELYAVPSHKSQSFTPLIVCVIGGAVDDHIIIIPVWKPSLFSCAAVGLAGSVPRLGNCDCRTLLINRR